MGTEKHATSSRQGNPSLPAQSSECVGRDQEVEQLQAAFARARDSGHGTTVLVTGSEGLGKSTLLAEAERHLRDQGALVLVSRCQPGLPAYGPIRTLVRSALHQLYGVVTPASRLEEWEPLLDILDGRAVAGGPAAGSPSDRIRLYDHVTELLRFASAIQPLAIVVHDLDLADQGTRDLFGFMARVLTSSPELALAPFHGLLVASASDGAVLSSDPTWGEDVSLLQLTLQALDAEGVRAFLSSDEVVRRVLDTTGGVPRVLDALLMEGRLPAGGQPAALEGASEEEVQLLKVLAVVGQPAGPEMLRELCLLPPDRLGRAISGLAERRVVEKVVVDGEIRVGLMRSADQAAVYDGLTDHERRDLHSRVGDHLAHRGEDQTETFAFHLLRGRPSQEAVSRALEAGQRLEIGCSFCQAADLYEHALPLARDAELKAQLADRLSAVYEITGRLDLALEQAERLRRWRPDDPELAARMAHLHLLCDNPAAARAELELLEHHEPTSPTERLEVQALRARVETSTAEAQLMEGGIDGALEAVQRGRALCDEAPSPALEQVRLQLANILAKVHLLRQEYEDAEELLAVNLRSARDADRPLEELRVLALLGQTALALGRHEAAEERYAEARALAERVGEHRLLGACLQHMGVLAERRRDYRQALELYQQAVAVWKKTGHRLYLAWVAMDLGKLYLELGDRSRARALADLSERLVATEPTVAARINLHLLWGQIAEQESRFSEATTRLEQARALAEESGQRERLTRSLLALASLQLCQGQPDAALPLIDRADPPAGRHLALAALLLRAQVLMETGAAEAAHPHLAEALELSETLADPEARWQAQFHLARLARQQGRPAEARRLLAEAAAGEAGVRDRVPEELTEHLADQPLRVALRAALEAAGSEPTERPPSTRQSAPRRDRRGFEEIIGSHPRLLQVLDHVERVAPTDTTVLVRGESGTGKELVARAVHALSQRAARPMVTVNCGALVESLLLSELFGHEKGAFTGASQRRKGRFELADGGTIFLDEIGDISPRTQAALLRVLQEREIERVGGTVSIKVDVRVICATNRDLEGMVARGEFREDLYYRLRGVQLHLPPLRERKEDVPVLARHFLDAIAAERGEPARELSAEADSLLTAYRWPGNIRELKNVLRSVSLLADSQLLDVEAFTEYPELMTTSQTRPPTPDPAPVARLAASTDAAAEAADEGAAPNAFEQIRAGKLTLKEYKSQLELRLIRAALDETEGNITHAAKLLGMKRPRLSQIIKQHGIKAS